MKAFLVVLAVAFVFVNGESESSEEFVIKELQEVNEILTEKFNTSIVDDILNLVKNVTENCTVVERKFETTVDKARSCLALPIKPERICSLIRKNSETCVKPVRELVKRCVPEKLKEPSVSAEKMILDLLDQVCNSTVEEILANGEFDKKKFNTSTVDDIINLVKNVTENCTGVERESESIAGQVGTCLALEMKSETICSLIRKNYDRCTKPIRDIVKRCVPEKSQELPVLAEKMILVSIDRYCNSTVKEFLDLLNPCSFGKDITETESCKEIVEVVQKYKKNTSKELICDMLPKIKKCIKDHQEATCKNTVTIPSHVVFIEAIEDALKGECETLNKT